MDKYIGKLLDNRYEILEVIGVGGMAMVYKARCHRLNRLVAVKILKDEYASDADFRRRFHAESQAVAMLSHPNIVAVYDVSRSEEIEYIVMELIDGITLKQYIHRTGALGWREALHYVTQIVKALSHAHSRGIIHRDIKPHNIMVLRDGSVKVADFGIARFAAKQSTLTQEALGSVHYISPEQARGSHIDARSDVYSVGVVLYEMLTNRLPYEGDSPVAVAIQHINSMPLTLREINPEIPETLESITLKAMASDVSRRYASADEMLLDLEEFRRNPSIVINYDMFADTQSQEDGEQDPTRKIPVVGNQPPPPPRDASKPPTRIGGRKPPADKKNTRKQPAPRAAQKPGRQERARQYDDAPRRRHSIAPALGATAALLLFVAALAYAVTQIIPGLFQPPVDVQREFVPSVIGMTIERANETHGHLFIFSPEVYENHSTIPAGQIMRQHPLAGQGEVLGTVVRCTVSRGPVTIQMPDLTDMEFRYAQVTVDGIRDVRVIYNSVIEYEPHEEFRRDRVIRTDPPAGSILRDGDVITFYVSTGPVLQQFEMPELIGLTETAAEALLQELKLQRGDVGYREDDAAAGTVIEQSIARGVVVTEGDRVGFTVSLGPPEIIEPSSTPEPTWPPWIPPTATPTPGPTTRTYTLYFWPLGNAVGQFRVEIFQDGVLIHDEHYSFGGDRREASIVINQPAHTTVSWIEIRFNGEHNAAYHVDFVLGQRT